MVNTPFAIAQPNIQHQHPMGLLNFCAWTTLPYNWALQLPPSQCLCAIATYNASAAIYNTAVYRDGKAAQSSRKHRAGKASRRH